MSSIDGPNCLVITFWVISTSNIQSYAIKESQQINEKKEENNKELDIQFPFSYILCNIHAIQNIDNLRIFFN
jgi:hypothetical protein